MIWKDIEGYEGRYQVSDTGLIKSCEHYHPTMIKGTPVMRHKKEQLLKQWKRSSYYKETYLHHQWFYLLSI